MQRSSKISNNPMIYKIKREVDESDSKFITDLPNLFEDKNVKRKKLLDTSTFQTQQKFKLKKKYRYPKPGQTWLTAVKNNY